MNEIDEAGEPQREMDPNEIEPAPEVLLDCQGNPVTGIGRLDQIIGAKAAAELLEKREQSKRALYSRAVDKWGLPESRL